MSGMTSVEFYDHYWSHSPDFSSLNPSSIFRRQWVVSWSLMLPWKSHLDVGCGNGHLIHNISLANPEGKSHSGVDVSPQVISRNSRILPRHVFHVADISRDAVPGTFDLVTCLEVLEHLPQERLQSAASHLASCCAPGGHILITVPTGRIHDTERAFGHFHHFTMTELEGLFHRQGIETVSSQQWGWPFHDLSRELANIHSKGSLRVFASENPSLFSKAVFSFWTLLNRFNSFHRGQQLLFVGRKTPSLNPLSL